MHLGGELFKAFLYQLNVIAVIFVKEFLFSVRTVSQQIGKVFYIVRLFKALNKQRVKLFPLAFGSIDFSPLIESAKIL